MNSGDSILTMSGPQWITMDGCKVLDISAVKGDPGSLVHCNHGSTSQYYEVHDAMATDVGGSKLSACVTCGPL